MRKQSHFLENVSFQETHLYSYNQNAISTSSPNTENTQQSRPQKVGQEVGVPCTGARTKSLCVWPGYLALRRRARLFFPIIMHKLLNRAHTATARQWGKAQYNYYSSDGDDGGGVSGVEIRKAQARILAAKQRNSTDDCVLLPSQE